MITEVVNKATYRLSLIFSRESSICELYKIDFQLLLIMWNFDLWNANGNLILAFNIAPISLSPGKFDRISAITNIAL